MYRSYVSSGFSFRGGGSPAADDNDIRAAAQLLAKANIDPRSKQLFSGGLSLPYSEERGRTSGASSQWSVEFESEMLLLARVYKAEREYAQARQVCIDLIRANPLNTEAHYLFAWVCVETGDKKTAQAEFTAVVNLADPQTEMYREAQAALRRLSR